ncbi:MAG: hypothetical protein NC915_03210 [Candidatus Omnitrophica bacterium]|nr:hypothetical protein [Candidatus Omnitrophota bacterium]
MVEIYNDRIEGLYCKCTKGDVAIFEILKDCIRCIYCKNEIKCKPPIEFVWKEKCPHCEGKMSTFIIDSSGIKICSRCGLSK